MIISAFSIRKELFLCCVSLARSTYVCAVQKGAYELAQLSRGTELNHIILIDKYLMDNYPELTKAHCLKGVEKDNLRAQDWFDEICS